MRDSARADDVADERLARLPERVARTEKVASIVARRIVADIVERDLKPGMSLEPEAQMLQRYGVSRASLREALRILEIQGLLTIKTGPGGGPSVGDVSSQDFGRMATLFFRILRVDLGTLIEARLILEPIMASLAATRADQAANERLAEIVRAHDASAGDREWIRVTNLFHTTILSMSGNPLLDLIARSLKDIYTDQVSGLVFPREKREHVKRTHKRITNAIVSGDAETAQRLMREHMRNYAEFFAQRYPDLMSELVDWR